jgi:hypothetical protein
MDVLQKAVCLQVRWPSSDAWFSFVTFRRTEA